ncbi:MAG: DUF4345 domain-containing protein [Betaproteobacteria bacterium]|nr:DUF4345 domain-containing protein [Betaproteobacteria bacterium]
MIAPVHIKKWFLIASALTIFGVASLYGIAPYGFAEKHLGIAAAHPNLVHILRAMMFMYFGFGLFWLYAAFRPEYRNPALLTVMLFPAGLVIGRIVSWFADGQPSPLLFFYLVTELIQAPLAWWVFRLPD